MRFSYAESMTDPSFYAPLARAAEEAGYDSMVVPDSICYPLHASSRYPFNPDGSREFLEDKPFLEPFSLIPALGAVTTRLRFVTFVVKLPVRNPVLVAKQATSTAVLTGNRLVLGVGHQPVARGLRGARRAVGGPRAADGRGARHHPRAVGRRVLRVPRGGLRLPAGQDRPGAQPSRSRSSSAGTRDAALRRAARAGDGWLHGGGDPADLPGLLARLGRAPAARRAPAAGRSRCT